MIAAWMLYATALGVLCCAAGRAAEYALHLARRPRRGAWAAALVLAAALPAAAPWWAVSEDAAGPTSTSRAVAATILPTVAAPAAAPAPAGRARDGRFVPRVRAALAARVAPRTLAVRTDGALARWDRPLAVLWAVAGFAWLALVGGGAWHLARRARRWRPVLVDGVPVLASHDVGPALLGVLAPRIVVPAWVLDLPPERRALVLAHEREHAAARDPLLVTAGALVLALAPWNAALWYALRRLHLAVEADCDARVLRRRPDVRAYGALLLDVGERALAVAAPVPALAGSFTHLSQRIALMTARPTRHRTPRLAGALAAGGLALAGAYCAPRPAAQAPTPASDGSAELARADSLARPQFARLDSLAAADRRTFARLDSLAWASGTREAAMRQAVAAHFPTALQGGMGPHATVWFLVDARDGTVLRTAAGRHGFSRWGYAYVRDSMPYQFAFVARDSARLADVRAHGLEYLDAAAAQRTFPDAFPTAQDATARVESLEGRRVANGPVTVDVEWIRARPAPGDARRGTR